MYTKVLFQRLLNENNIFYGKHIDLNLNVKRGLVQDS